MKANAALEGRLSGNDKSLSILGIVNCCPFFYAKLGVLNYNAVFLTIQIFYRDKEKPF